jgi:DNA-binding SARP family transcriptional activator
LSVYLLGHFRVRRHGAPLPLGRKVPWRPLRLLQAIAVLGPREASVSRVVTALWPDAEGDAGARAFEIAVHRLRRLLGDPGAVTVSRGHVGLDPARVWVDAEAFETLATASERDGDAGIAERAMALYEGPLLAHEEDSAWLLPARERLHSRFRRVAAHGAVLLERAGRREQAIDLLRRALEREPLAEELHRRLIASLAAAGRQAEAIQAFRHCEHLLVRVLGVQPSAETRNACAGAAPGN